MKILLLENDSNKGQEILEVLEKDNHQVDQRFCVNKIKTELSKTKYDVLIADLKVPLKNSGEEKLTYGAGLIQYVFDSVQIFHRPKAVFVITEYQDEDIVEGLKSYPVSIIPYSPVGEWKKLLRQRLAYYGRLQCDIAVITAVDVEFEAFSKWEWNLEDKVKDLTYYSKEIRNVQNQTIRIILVRQEQMGMVAATNLTDKIINYFTPKCIIMGGICAGRKNRVQMGDVIVAVSAWDYGSGSVEKKNTNENEEIEFIPAPNYISISEEIKNIFAKYDTNLLAQFNKEIFYAAVREEDVDLITMSMNMRKQKSKIHLGAMASGAAVIKNEKFTNMFVKAQNRKYVGLDMETYGVYYAARQSSRNLQYFCVKSVSDYSDNDKDDKYQQYSALLSCEVIKYYINNNFEL